MSQYQRIIRRFFQLAAVLLGCLNIANAEQLNLETIKDNWGITLGGAATTIVIHELGHFLAAELENVDASFDGVTIKYDNTEGTDRQGLRLSSAGYQMQWLASEYAFWQLSRPQISARTRAWNTGIVLGHIGITAAYLSFLKDQQEGDSVGVSEATNMSTDQLVALLAIPAVLDSWRLFGKHSPRWASWASRGFKTVGISAIWTF